MTRILGLIFLLLVLMIGLTFAVLNANPVTVNYYFGSREAPLSLVLVLALIVGAVLGVLATTGLVLRLKRENSRLQRANRVAEREVANLRTMPIKDVH